MKKSVVLVCMLSLSSSHVFSKTCEEFTQLGAKVESLEHLVKQPATREQVDEFKLVLSQYVKNVRGEKNKALQLIRENKKLTIFVRESLGMTRGDCFVYPKKSMEKSTIENFDLLLRAVIDGANYE